MFVVERTTVLSASAAFSMASVTRFAASDKRLTIELAVFEFGVVSSARWRPMMSDSRGSLKSILPGPLDSLSLTTVAPPPPCVLAGRRSARVVSLGRMRDARPGEDGGAHAEGYSQPPDSTDMTRSAHGFLLGEVTERGRRYAQHAGEMIGIREKFSSAIILFALRFVASK